jgi:hypothetical protein
MMRTGDCVPSDVYVGVIHSSILLGRVWLECKGKNIDILVMIYYYIRNVCYNQLVRNRFYKKKHFSVLIEQEKRLFFVVITLESPDGDSCLRRDLL